MTQRLTGGEVYDLLARAMARRASDTDRTLALRIVRRYPDTYVARLLTEAYQLTKERRWTRPTSP